jgi:tRNA pseudouridine38-40 synthase
LRLDLGYDGTDFVGWAHQPGLRTVGGVVAAALGRIFGGEARITVAGRTDAGVHATGQVCHLDVPTARWDAVRDTVVTRLAGLLPRDVRVWAVTEVPETFDARFSALFRRYEYRVSDAPWGAPPLRHRDTLGWPHPLDLTALTAASRLLLGEHDFAAFCRSRPNTTTIREMVRFDWQRAADSVVIATVEADAFCQAMVRSLVGALLPVGDGRRGPEWPAALLTRRERAGEVTVAPPYGLTLVHVGYPADEAGFAARAALTRRIRTFSGSLAESA